MMFKEPHSVTDLALCATKAIGRSMASLVLLQCYLWLNHTEVKEVDKGPFFDSSVSPTCLFGLLHRSSPK